MLEGQSSIGIAIKADKINKTFRLPHEKTSTIKSAVVNFYRKQRTYETQQALRDVSFEINKGDFFGIVGRNGSGKSTLLKLLAGIYTPTSGKVTVKGSLTPFIELGVGFNPELTGRENIFLSGALLGFSRKEMLSMYDEIVDFAELKKFMDQKLKNYSSGMQVRLAFSIAIRAESDILLLDEVLAVGDGAFQQKCFNYFEELKSQNRTVVFVSHDMGAVRRFCNRAIYIKDGKLVLQGTPSEVADIYLVENIDDSAHKKPTKGTPVSKVHSVTSRIVSQSDQHVLLEVSYQSEDKSGMYVGISVQKDGISIGEITTRLNNALAGNGIVRYSLDTTNFNGGTYAIGVGLFTVENRALVGVAREKNQFVVKGNDITKGAALKLQDNWIYG